MSGTNTRTPTLDALAANGTLFTDFHTGQAYCAPSRTAFMTGEAWLLSALQACIVSPAIQP